MQTAARSLAGAKDSGDPLPLIPELASLTALGFRPKRGQVVMVAGMPGSQKSGLALYLVEKWAEQGVESLYFSADQDQHETMTRLAGVVTGHSADTVASGLKRGAEDWYYDAISELPIAFCWDSAPDFDDLQQELDAYVELYDSWPQVIVIDNLINIQYEHESEWSALRMVLTELQSMARLTNATVLVLHHMAEGAFDPTKPAPRKALHGKVSQRPVIIVSLAFDPADCCVLASLVKNRSGKADPHGKQFTRLAVDPENTRFGPWVARPWGYQESEATEWLNQ